MTDEDRLQITVCSENIRWLYDVRGQIFRFYLLTLGAITAIVSFAGDDVKPTSMLCLVAGFVFLVLSACFWWQIGLQRRLRDKEQHRIAKAWDGHEEKVPALFYPADRKRVRFSTTAMYMYMIAVLAAGDAAYLLPAVLGFLWPTLTPGTGGSFTVVFAVLWLVLIAIGVFVSAVAISSHLPGKKE